MSLSYNHIDADSLEDEIMTGHAPQIGAEVFAKRHTPINDFQTAAQLSSHFVATLSQVKDKYRLPENGVEAPQAYQMVHDELALDGNPLLNLASFVNVHTDVEANTLISENLTKNLADNDEYPMLITLQDRCVATLGNLWHAPTEPYESDTVLRRSKAIGVACTGSSEAVMLGGLAMKKNWQARQRKLGKDASNPNILMASCCQVALEKFARYFDVQARIIPVSPDNYLIDYDLIKPQLDENTIGIFVIVGSTFTGGFEDVGRVNGILDEYEKETGYSIPIHVDGASGGFVAPIMYPELEWDFRVPRVKSINTSGHKFGLTTAGLGWVIFRESEWLPQELKFQIDYLGGLEESYSLNFSRPGYQVIHQYYNFQRLGRQGYHALFENCMVNAKVLSEFLERTGYFKCVSGLLVKGTNETDFTPEKSLPVVSFQMTPEFIKEYPEIPQAYISKMLRDRQWIVPNYALPRSSAGEPKVQTQDPETGANNEILRVVVKYDLTSQLLDRLMHDIVSVVEVLKSSCAVVRSNVESGTSPDVTMRALHDMLLSISRDGDVRSLEKGITKADVSKRPHLSYRGIC